jgi:hypothetical protein
LSIDGYDAEFDLFFKGIALMVRRAWLCETAPFWFGSIKCKDAIFAHRSWIKKYLNNWLDFFIKLVSLLKYKGALWFGGPVSFRGKFHLSKWHPAA